LKGGKASKGKFSSQSEGNGSGVRQEVQKRGTKKRRGSTAFQESGEGGEDAPDFWRGGGEKQN